MNRKIAATKLPGQVTSSDPFLNFEISTASFMCKHVIMRIDSLLLTDIYYETSSDSM